MEKGIKERIKERRQQKMQDRALASAKILGSLPKSIDPLTLASFRMQEIREMEQDLKEAKLNKKRSLFQTMPKHLRRRAASHNPKRIPKAHRKCTGNMNIDGRDGGGLGKKPKKFHRHAPLISKKQRISEYKSRQSTCKWLETHIWHAKRFKMTDYWGFKVASKSNQKVFRYNFQMGQTACCIHDFSFMRPFWIESERLKSFLAQECLSPIAIQDSKAFTAILKDYSSLIYVAFLSGKWLLLVHPSASSFSHFEVEQAQPMNVFEIFGDASETILDKIVLGLESEISCISFPSPFKLTSKYFLAFIPQHKGKETWRKLIYANCKPFSLEDKFHFHFENASLYFPDFYSPKSEAFHEIMRKRAQQLQSEWNSKPPAKRVNYAKFGVTSPFMLLMMACLPNEEWKECEMVFIEAISSGVPLYNGILMHDLEFIGSVVYGNFSLLRGKGFGVALVKAEYAKSTSILKCRNIDSPAEHSFECRITID